MDCVASDNDLNVSLNGCAADHLSVMITSETVQAVQIEATVSLRYALRQPSLTQRQYKNVKPPRKRTCKAPVVYPTVTPKYSS